MTVQTVRSGATAHPEEMFDFALTHLLDTSGVKNAGASGDLEVTEKGTPDMSVDVAMGYAFIAKADGSRVYPVRVYSTASNVAVTANSSGNPRIDAVVVYIDLGASPNAGATNVATIVVIAGTAGASPSAPTDGEIQTAIGAGYPFLRLANIAVASGATEIENADITDTRVQALFSLANFTTDEVTSWTNKTLVSPVINVGISGTAIADEDNMASNSATKVPTQQSVKAYVDTHASDTTSHGTTGNIVGTSDTQTLTNKTNVAKVIAYTPSTSPQALDLATGNIFNVTMYNALALTLTIANATVGQVFMVEINNVTGQGALTWFSTIRWTSGVVPTLTGVNGKRDVFGFRVTGTDTYDGFIVGQNI